MRLIPSLIAAAAVVACSDSFSPTVENVAGDYTLSTLVTTDTSGTVDWRSRGATFTLTLAPGGTTSGNLFIPGADEGGGDFNADMAGTWSLSDGVITFDQTADTFVRDMDFSARKDRISGDQTFGFDATATRVRIVLTK